MSLGWKGSRSPLMVHIRSQSSVWAAASNSVPVRETTWKWMRQSYGWEIIYELIGPCDIWMKFQVSNFQANFVSSHWRLRYLLWNCPQPPKGLSLDCTHDMYTLVLVMAWCHQATSHYLNQCWPTFTPPYAFTSPQWVNHSLSEYILRNVRT